MWGIGYRPMAVYCPPVPRPYRQITSFPLFCRPQAHSILWIQFSSWRGYIRFLLWRPGWAHQSKRGLVFRCCPSLHCATFGAAHLRGSFNRAEHCFTVSINSSSDIFTFIPPFSLSLLFVVWRFGRAARKNLGKRISYTEKIYISWLIILEKKSYIAFCREKIYHQGFEEKIFLTKPNHPYAPLKVKWSAP